MRYFDNLRLKFKINKIEELYKINIQVNFLFYCNLKLFPLNFIHYMNAIIRLLRSSFFFKDRNHKYYTLLKKKFKFINIILLLKNF